MVIKECNVVGIERIEGKRKSDNKEFGFWKLHLMADFPQYNGKPAGEGQKVLSCNINDDDYQRSTITVGSMVDIFTRGQYTEFISESAT